MSGDHLSEEFCLSGRVLAVACVAAGDFPIAHHEDVVAQAKCFFEGVGQDDDGFSGGALVPHDPKYVLFRSRV